MQTPATADLHARQMATQLIVPAANNFVERPWGGTQLRELKGLCPLPEQVEIGGSGIGESFELAAFDDDREAAEHPSIVTDPAGQSQSLSALLRRDADAFLGPQWLQRYGPCIPLLPKFLNVRELLSVQGHPPGHTEAYIVADAEPGATIRLGFRRDVDPVEFRARLEAGIAQQRRVGTLLGSNSDWADIQRLLGAWLAERDSDADEFAAQFSNYDSDLEHLFDSLKRAYWYVLDAMNEIELVPGQVIHNTIPQRIIERDQRLPVAEVHALGNPQRREFTMLEVRRPGPTLRAWDNVRFPMREVDIEASLEVLNLSATRPDEFICKRAPADDNGWSISVDSPYFRIEHIDAHSAESFDVAADAPHCLHVLEGSIEISANDSEDSIVLSRGHSAFVPFGVRKWSGRARNKALHLVKVALP